VDFEIFIFARLFCILAGNEQAKMVIKTEAQGAEYWSTCFFKEGNVMLQCLIGIFYVHRSDILWRHRPLISNPEE